MVERERNAWREGKGKRFIFLGARSVVVLPSLHFTPTLLLPLWGPFFVPDLALSSPKPRSIHFPGYQLLAAMLPLAAVMDLIMPPICELPLVGKGKVGMLKMLYERL